MLNHHITTALFLLFSSIVTLTTAFPSGAGNCPAGFAATGGAHRSKLFRSGSLQRGEFDLTIMDGDGANTTMVANRAIALEQGTNYTLMVTANDETFKGILVRMAGGRRRINAATDILVDEDKLDEFDLRFADDVCRDNVLGVTHKTNSVKEGVEIGFSIEEEDINIPVDVTIVVTNSGGESIYYYSRYWINTNGSSSSGRLKRFLCRFLPIC